MLHIIFISFLNVFKYCFESLLFLSICCIRHNVKKQKFDVKDIKR